MNCSPNEAKLPMLIKETGKKGFKEHDWKDTSALKE